MSDGQPGDESELEALRAAFERDGFVNAGPILGAEELPELNSEIESRLLATFMSDPPIPGRALFGKDMGRTQDHHYHLLEIWRYHEPFRRLMSHPRLMRVASTLMGSPMVQLWADTVQYKPAKVGAPFAMHQDAPYHLYIEPRERVIAAWVALDDADEGNGCMWMVPGSHRWGLAGKYLAELARAESTEELSGLSIPRAATDQMRREWRGVAACPVRAGEVHFHHSMTWHGSPHNQSSRARRGYTIFLMPDGIRVTRADARHGLQVGMLMRDAGDAFPVLYRAPPET